MNVVLVTCTGLPVAPPPFAPPAPLTPATVQVQIVKTKAAPVK